jgi:serine/threonine protein kinase
MFAKPHALVRQPTRAVCLETTSATADGEAPAEAAIEVMSIGTTESASGYDIVRRATFSIKRSLFAAAHSPICAPMKILEIGEEVGRGSFAIVRRAVVQTEDGSASHAVIKMSRHAGSSSVAWESSVLAHVKKYSPAHVRLLAPMWTGLVSHESCAPVLSAVYPFASGGDAIQWLSTRPLPISQSTMAGVWRDLAHALHAFHSHGIAHMDICVENILFDELDRCHIADAGLATNLMPTHDFWRRMKSSSAIAALQEFKKHELYKKTLGNDSEEEQLVYSRRKIAELERISHTSHIRDQLRNFIDLPSDERVREARRYVYESTLNVSSICAQSASPRQEWYQKYTIGNVGRIPYRPPESEYSKFAPIDLFAWDVWTLGICMYALLFKRLPFESTHCERAALFRDKAVGIAAITPETELNQWPLSAIDLIDKCLCIHPEKRIRASEMVHHPFIADIRRESESV